MKTLITGVPGWLGNRLLNVITDPNHELNKAFNTLPDRDIVCLVLPHLVDKMPRRARTTYVAADITKPETLAGKLEGVDTIFHLAGIIHPKKISELYSINTDGTKHLLAEAIKAGVKRFVFISSNSVAGIGKPGQLFTEQDPYSPYLHYGKSKMLAEEALLKAANQGNIEVTIFRFCWFYGPDQPDRQTRFFHMIAKGNPIIFGDGENLRSMSYVDNSIQAILLAERNPKAVNQIYWVADEKPYKTREIYETIATLLNVKLKPRFVPNIASSMCYLADVALQTLGLYVKEFHVAGEMNKTIACSVEKAKRDLGYKPSVSLEEGMRRSIEWCRQHGQL